MSSTLIIIFGTVGILSLCIGVVFFFIFRKKARGRQGIQSTFNKVMLLVTLPKEGSIRGGDSKDYNPDQVKRTISAA
ncbi:MAG: hypothetical protein COU27_02280, partial [Candidatus Levybacteria bacterium CG10_big_fil_rev_8_21_14_0_10_36_7]